MVKKCKTNCELTDKICNESTGRCVTKTGKIGKALILKRKSPSPKRKPSSPKRKPSSPKRKPSSPKRKELSQIKNTINKCGLVEELKESEYNVYGNKMLLDKERECKVDEKYVEEHIKSQENLINKYNNLIDSIYNYTLNNNDKIFNLLVRRLNKKPTSNNPEIMTRILTSQLYIEDFLKYKRFASKFFVSLQSKNEKDTIMDFLNLLNVSKEYNDNTGILIFIFEVLYDITLEDKELAQIKIDIVDYLQKHQEFQNMVKNRLIDAYTTGFEDKTYTSSNNEIVMKKDSILYRGVGLTKYKQPREKEWFAFDISNAFKYVRDIAKKAANYRISRYCKEGTGSLNIFRVNKDVKLLNFSNIDVIKKIKNEITLQILDLLRPEDRKYEVSMYAPSYLTREQKRVYYNKANLLKDFNEAFIISTDKNGKEILTRHSEYSADRAITDWLCENGYEGYAADHFTTLQSEVFLCNPKKYLEYVGNFNRDELVHFCNKVYTDENLSYENNKRWDRPPFVECSMCKKLLPLSSFPKHVFDNTRTPRYVKPIRCSKCVSSFGWGQPELNPNYIYQ